MVVEIVVPPGLRTVVLFGVEEIPWAYDFVTVLPDFLVEVTLVPGLAVCL